MNLASIDKLNSILNIYTDKGNSFIFDKTEVSNMDVAYNLYFNDYTNMIFSIYLSNIHKVIYLVTGEGCIEYSQFVKPNIVIALSFDKYYLLKFKFRFHYANIRYIPRN